MRLGKMCGLLMKAFLAVLMLFVTAAAVEVYWEDEFDEAIAISAKVLSLRRSTSIWILEKQLWLILI